MKFEYLGEGNECVFLPHKIDLEKKGQIIETDSKEIEQELKSRPDKFKPLEGGKKKGAE